ADAAPTPKASACCRIRSARRSRTSAGRILLSRSPRIARHPAGKTTAAATTGPASGPRPASSTPTRSSFPAQALRPRFSEGRRGLGSALLLPPNACGLTAQRAQVVQLGAADSAAAHELHRRDRRAMHREEALHAHTGRDLPHGEVLADATTALGDDQPLECLEPFLIALANPYHHPDRVSRIERRNVRAQALTGHLCQSLHRRILQVKN